VGIDFNELANAIVTADLETAVALTRKGVDDGNADGRDAGEVAKEILNKGLIGGMDIISELWARRRSLSRRCCCPRRQCMLAWAP